MNQRKAFTLIEMLVVIGIILLLAGILLPLVTGSRKRAEIIAQKMDFQTISAALEQYRQDFGDYPRNINLPTYSYTANSDLLPQKYLTLASALLGPGPNITLNVNNTYVGGGTYESATQSGDGSSGPGFRVRYMTLPISGMGVVAAQAPTVSGTFNWPSVNPPPPNPTKPQVSYTFLVDLAANPGSTPPVPEEVVPIGSVTTWTPTQQATFTSVAFTASFPTGISPNYSHSSGSLRVVIGRPWASYIPDTNFKVMWDEEPVPLPTGEASSGSTPTIGQPILLDRWGGEIQYFPIYGKWSLRTDSYAYTSTIAGENVTLGPIWGYAVPNTIDSSKYGQHAIMDMNDAPNWPPIGTNVPYQSIWQDYPTTGTPTYAPELALLWMLGDEHETDTTNSPYFLNQPSVAVAHPQETLRYDGPYILISPGPLGMYCNMFGLANNDQKFQAFKQSQNIYNFER